MNDARHSAYMGGRGAGKTFALVVRALRYAYQPKAEGEIPPVGCLLTDSFPHLKDIVYPAFFKVAEMTGLKFKEVKNQSDRKFILDNGAQILMRSLDQPDRVRGLNLSWFGIDEGRMFEDDYAYKVLLAAMRQPGYKQAGWVCSTPAGFDWQWRRFHPDSPKRRPNTAWFNAPTFDNEGHLNHEFLSDLQADYEGLFYQQEVLGEFVGAVGGAVWPMFDPRKHVDFVTYNPSLPLYAGWDFGIGDAGICLFAQIAWTDKVLYDGSTVQVPQLRLLGQIEETDLTIKEWADKFYQYCDNHFNGRVPDVMYGDPAGLQRQSITGTSAIEALGTHGVYVSPAPRRPIDEGIIIVQNLMERDGGFALPMDDVRLQQAVQTYRWKVDEEGNRLSREPVHDWTSHTCSALRYLAIGTIGLHSRRTLRPTEHAQRGTMGYILGQIQDANSEGTEMHNEGKPRIDWHQDQPVGLDGLF